LWAANEVLSFGPGGIRAVSEALRMSQTTLVEGVRELQGGRGDAEGCPLPVGRQRRPGGGRKSATVKQAGIVGVVASIVDPSTRGDPMAPLKWTSKSLEHIGQELGKAGYKASTTTISKILREDLGYSLQAMKKTREGSSHPERNAQFEHLSGQCKAFQERHQPVVSVDTKKKELVGGFKNGGREWQPAGQPQEAPIHDFVDKQLGKAVPYGVYDMDKNAGWVSVGIDHDTAEFAVASIRHWWLWMGRVAYPEAQELLITADAGGSNGYRPRLWKRELQKLADETNLIITVCHFPPGTSKWNKIEHRMFCHITHNWRGRPLINLEAIVNLIANTRTSKGLTIQAALDTGSYEKGIQVSDEEMDQLNLTPANFHGEWNYSIAPRNAQHPNLFAPG
jgi:hypothetical protein